MFIEGSEDILKMSIPTLLPHFWEYCVKRMSHTLENPSYDQSVEGRNYYLRKLAKSGSAHTPRDTITHSDVCSIMCTLTSYPKRDRESYKDRDLVNPRM